MAKIFLLLIYSSYFLFQSSYSDYRIQELFKHDDKASCKTLLIVTSLKTQENFSSITVIDIPQVLITYNLSGNKYTSDDYFDKVYTEPELLFPKYLGPIRLSPQCQISSFYTSSESYPDELQRLTKFAVSNEYTRAHIDYFLFVSYSEIHIHNFIQSKFSVEIRYKYYIKEDSAIDVCMNQELDFEIDPKKSSLFGYKCKETLNGIQLKISTLKGSSWLRYREDSEGNAVGDFVGIDYMLLQDSSQRYNFTFTIHSQRASGYLENGRWHGIVGEVLGRVADVGMGPGITPSRDTAVGYGVTVDVLARTFFIQAPSASRSWRAIFSPLRIQVWSFILISGLCIVPICYFSLKTNPQMQYSLSKVAMSVLGICAEQSVGNKYWVGVKIKTLILLWMFFCLVIGSGYRSRLVFFLTFNKPREVPTTHEALIDQNYKLLFRYYGGVAYNYAQASPDPMQHEIVRRASLINSSQECMVAIILDENTACLDWDVHGTFAVYTNSTVHVRQAKDLIVMSKDFVLSNLQITWLFRKKSPLIQSFNSYLRIIWASGISNKLQIDDYSERKILASRWLNENKHLQTNAKILKVYEHFLNVKKSLPISSFLGLFALLLMGEILGLIVYIFELLKYNYHNYV